MLLHLNSQRNVSQRGYSIEINKPRWGLPTRYEFSEYIRKLST